MLNRSLSVAAAVAVSATFLAACSGGSSLSPAVTNAGSSSMTQAIHANPAATLTVKPTKMTFTTKAQQQAQLSPNTDFYSQKNTCVKKHILKSAKYFDYGIYYITPGKKNGTCSVTFTDTETKATATMTVVNSIK